jgi:processive 1,2-diacylglycerol beta-glucosyltransferase
MHALVERLIAAHGQRSRPARLIGWTREVPALLASSHLLISKAGGATTQETIAAGCPMIVSQIAPGQEEGNAQLLVDNGAGCLALSPDAIASAVQRAFTDDAALCREWSTNIARLSRPDAARDNARFILSQADVAHD